MQDARIWSGVAAAVERGDVTYAGGWVVVFELLEEDEGCRIEGGRVEGRVL